MDIHINGQRVWVSIRISSHCGRLMDIHTDICSDVRTDCSTREDTIYDGDTWRSNTSNVYVADHMQVTSQETHQQVDEKELPVNFGIMLNVSRVTRLLFWNIS